MRPVLALLGLALVGACSSSASPPAGFGTNGDDSTGTQGAPDGGVAGEGDGGAVSSSGGSGSGSGGSTRDAGSQYAAVCATAGQALCGRVQGCWPSLVLEEYGDVASCAQRFALQCEGQLSAPHTGWTPSYVQACYAAIAAGSCASYFDGTLPAACTAPGGGVADGSACGESGQCGANSTCRKAKGSYCGTCTPRAAMGASCTSADCEPGLVCNSSSVCASYVQQTGGSCSATNPCGYPLHCKGGKCVAGAQAGGACSSTSDTCDVTAGLYCDTTTSSCQPVKFVSAGASCGQSGGSLNVCDDGTYCSGTSGAATGTCTAPAAEGAACDASAGPYCMAPAYCNGGVCTLPDASSCH